MMGCVLRYTCASFQRRARSIRALVRVGETQSSVAYLPVSSFSPWIKNFIGNIQSAEMELLRRKLATEEEIRQGTEDLTRLMDDKAGSAFFIGIELVL